MRQRQTLTGCSGCTTTRDEVPIPCRAEGTIGPSLGRGGGCPWLWAGRLVWFPDPVLPQVVRIPSSPPVRAVCRDHAGVSPAVGRVLER